MEPGSQKTLAELREQNDQQLWIQFGIPPGTQLPPPRGSDIHTYTPAEILEPLVSSASGAGEVDRATG